jgi:hypothetical protein
VKFSSQHSFVQEAWRQVCPQGVALGERLAASQELLAMRKVCCPVVEVIDWLESQYLQN